MTGKLVENKQWLVCELKTRIDNNEIEKPKFQRKKKWDIKLKKNNSPNESDYIKFLYKTLNTVNVITFGIDSKGNLSNIDGNNRINAIMHFLNKPFEIWSHLLIEIYKYIDNIQDFSYEDKCKLKDIIKNLSYNDIVEFNYKKYFIENDYKEFYNDKLKILRDDMEELLENIKDELKINNMRFDQIVKVNVNIFIKYTIDELCQIFEDINKYNTKLTETELLASKLYNETNFKINDKSLYEVLRVNINKYYSNKAEGEVLECYEFKDGDTMNAHDFMIGFQEKCHSKYNFIEEVNSDGLSLFYKLYKTIYGFEYKGNGENINGFTTENVNGFIKKIEIACSIFEKVVNEIFTDNINVKLFNSACQKKLYTLSKNNIYMLLASIIGYCDKNIPQKEIIKELEKCVLFHLLTSEIKNKEIRDDLNQNNSIVYMAGGQYIDGISKKMLSKPEMISNKITKENFNNVIKELMLQYNEPCERFLDNGNKKNDKRRFLPFWAKTLMFYYYKQKIPVDQLNHIFSIEHIFPNSSEWDGEIDKDRFGNLIPIPLQMNVARQNKHIKVYKEKEESKMFFEFIKDLIPNDNDYNIVITHDDRVPYISDNDKYDEICNKNEKIYRKNFINCLFNV